MEKYKCIKAFELPKYDENNSPTDNYGKVEEGSVWEYAHDYVSEADARLYLVNGNSDFDFIDIIHERLEEYFQKIA